MVGGEDKISKMMNVVTIAKKPEYSRKRPRKSVSYTAARPRTCPQVYQGRAENA